MAYHIAGVEVGCKEVQVSLVIYEDGENKHRGGINSLQLDPVTDRFYSAGRDGIIRVWMQETHVRNMEHHTDWVNDIILCCDGRNLISASSDNTVKVWDAHKGFCMATLRPHRDHVKALAYAKEREQIASGGVDKSIFLWDINTLTALSSSNNTITTTSLIGNKESIYSLTMNPSGSVIVSGSSEKILRVWDPRIFRELTQLEGHTDNVQALVVSADGTLCLSGSSDGTIKLWSIGQHRCVLTIRVHSDAVWAILATETYSHVISGGKDGKVVITKLENPNNSVIICTETAPILRICFAVGYQSVWVSTSESNIKQWKLPPYTEDFEDTEPQTQPISFIQGRAALRSATVLNDERHIITKDSDNNVAIYDVLKACKVEDLGLVDYQEEIKKRFQMLCVPKWFHVDTKIGMLTIHLGQGGVNCFSAWVSARDVGLPGCNESNPVNYGKLLLQALLEHWREDPRYRRRYFSVPDHTPLIFSEVGGRMLYRVLVGDTGGENETASLNKIVPKWVTSNIEENCSLSAIKEQFYLLPHSSMKKQNTTEKPDRLAVSDFVQCRKIAEHVVEHILCNDTVISSGGVGGENTSPAPTPSIRQVELLCNNEVLDPLMDLRTVKKYIWKSSTYMKLYYRLVK